MNLLALRHAIALDRTEWKKADAKRPLTKDGIKKMKKAAQGMRHLGIEFDWILTSPYRRAYDTAQIVAKEYKAGKKVRVVHALASNGDPKQLVQQLARDFRNSESVLIVGHEPYLGKLIGTLSAGDDGMGLELKKGGLCRLTSDSLTYGKCAQLEWILPPRLLRAAR